MKYRLKSDPSVECDADIAVVNQPSIIQHSENGITCYPQSEFEELWERVPYNSMPVEEELDRAYNNGHGAKFDLTVFFRAASEIRRLRKELRDNEEEYRDTYDLVRSIVGKRMRNI